jgi:cyclic beta-1,2-glucan synthetase
MSARWLVNSVISPFPEFAEQTLRTLSTMGRLPRHRGHFVNWYDTHSLAPLPPALISSVDSGNLVASLWALQQGCLDLLERPLFRPELAEGLLDHLYVLAKLGALPRRRFSAAEKAFRRSDWLQRLPAIREAFLRSASVRHEKHAHEAKWFREQAENWMERVSHSTHKYAPWLLPEFAALRNDPAIYSDKREDESLARLTAFIDSLERRLRVAIGSLEGLGERSILYQKLLAMLPETRAHVISLIADLTRISDQTRQLADEMDFGFLLNRQRGLLSIGFDTDTQQLHTACYDLLASEARIAYFVAIAKGEVPQESWFLLGRAPTTDTNTPGLLSWTGTMFEYLMPALWTRIYPNTLLERATTAAVRMQREYAAARRVPWGISESSSSRLDAAGNYSYFAFGVPDLAIHKPEASDPSPVISPYSTFLALHVDPQNALRNLRQMQHKHWQGDYGFYEAVDFTPGQSRSRGGEVVHCWMAHHQGMSFLSIANFLEKEIVQRWFHSDPRVQATELLLQEKPAALGIPAIARKPRAEVA